MKKKQVAILILLALTSHSWANESQEDEHTYWQCTAHDNEKTQWTFKSDYELSAANHALEACKKQSPHPNTCRVSKEECDVFVHGTSPFALWRCTALDQQSKPWRGKIYRTRDEAAYAAKVYCRNNSAIPDTCYVNFLTCKNLNERA